LAGIIADEGDGAGVGRSPGEEIGAASDKFGKKFYIVENELAIAADDFFAMADSEIGEEFAGGAAADGGVVLELGAELKNFLVAGGQPTEAKTGESVGFTHGAEAYGAFVELAAGGQARGRIVFQFAIDFVTKNVNAVARGEFHDAAEDRKRHE